MLLIKRLSQKLNRSITCLSAVIDHICRKQQMGKWRQLDLQ